MSSQLIVQAIGHLAMIVAVIGITAGVKAAASVLRTWIEQVFRTRRLNNALEGAGPEQRPKIISACGQLERAPAGEPDGDVADVVFQPGGQFRSLVPVSRHKRGGKRRKER